MSETPIFDVLFCEYAYTRRFLPKPIILLFVYGQSTDPHAR